MYTLFEDQALALKINQYLESKPNASKLEVEKKFHTTSYRLKMLIEGGLVSFQPPTEPFYKLRWNNHVKNQPKIPETLKWYTDRYGDKAI